jgi:enoyl-CoA hydratase/carnithine racemase
LSDLAPSSSADARTAILVERREGVAIVTLNRPRERNPLGLAFPDQMLGVLQQLDDDLGLHAVVLTGAGNVFCAGAELGQVVNPDGVDAELQFRFIRGLHKVVQRIRELELPVIAAVNGAAVGGGAALAMACDVAVASDKARYFFAFGRLGAAACDMGCSYLLPRIVGSVRARHWLLTGASVEAEAGRAAGLFVDVVPGERLLDAALAIAASIKQATPRRAGAASKLAIARGEDTDLQSCLSYEAYVQNYLFSTDDHKSRLRALMEQQKSK